MAVYTGSPAAFEKYQREHPDPEKRKEMDRKGMDAWMKWGEDHAKSIVENGGPLGRTKRVIADPRPAVARRGTVPRAGH